MNIKAAIIDHEMASLSEREIFACSQEQKEELYRRVSEHPEVMGGVLLNTCNRTELYLSMKDDIKGPDPFDFLCDSLDERARGFASVAKEVSGDEALSHLCMLTSGAASQLLGDSQIITQVSDALSEAQEMNMTDGALNTMFRLGVTAGKKVRTDINLQIKDTSTVDLAVRAVEEADDVKNILVIGNGTIGRLVAERLARRGYAVTMTLRQYHHKEAIVPPGVSVVPFADRYRQMEVSDAVISTTASPHIVITKQEFEQLTHRPQLLIDMAVPRDIDPEISEMEGVNCYNIDELSGGNLEALKPEQAEQLQEYIGGYVAELHRWEDQKMKKEADIKRLISPERDRAERRYFPLFIDSMDRLAVVIGGGNIAERRILTLAEFGFQIRVIAGTLSETLQRLVDAGLIEWQQGYVVEGEDAPEASDPGMVASSGNAGKERINLTQAAKDAWMLLACTNDRETNRAIGRYGREHNLLVNVCDARNESTFWFPAVGLSDELTMGLVGTGKDHMNVKKAAAMLRDVIEKKEYK
ncbi:MAG: hypothetical protein IJ108_01030 [Eubacterium sp.]|nr:hypothetical protein [Eubacterium sp.]